MGGFLPPAERRSGVLLALYAACSLLLLLAGERIPTSALRGAGAWIFAPFDRLVLAVDRAAAAWRENQRLHQRIAELELETQRLRDAGHDALRLRRDLGLLGARRLSLRPVEVLALSGEVLPSAATLSAGRRQGVREGDAVVTSDGLLGRVGEVYDGLSRAVLLTDPNVAVACEVESTGVLGVLRFALGPRPRLVLTNVPLTDTVQVGARVLTSGLSQRFPRGLPIGRVVHVGPDPGGLTQDIEIEPAARMSRLRHAFIVLRPGSPEDGP
jgi:rod shape-determining protein MreC